MKMIFFSCSGSATGSKRPPLVRIIDPRSGVIFVGDGFFITEQKNFLDGWRVNAKYYHFDNVKKMKATIIVIIIQIMTVIVKQQLSYSARRLDSTFWAVILVFDSWFLVLFLTDIEPCNFVEIFFHTKLQGSIFFFEGAESRGRLSVKGISLD